MSYLLNYSTMQNGIHTAQVQPAAASIRKGAVEHAVSRLHLLILLLNLVVVGLSLIILS